MCHSKSFLRTVRCCATTGCLGLPSCGSLPARLWQQRDAGCVLVSSKLLLPFLPLRSLTQPLAPWQREELTKELELRKPFLVRNQHATLRKISLPVSDSVVVKLNPKLLQILRRQCCLNYVLTSHKESPSIIIAMKINFDNIHLHDIITTTFTFNILFTFTQRCKKRFQ